MQPYHTKKPYTSALSVRETQRAIKLVKDTFQVRLAKALCLDRVTAPLIVEAGRGINDDLNGTERKVSFTIGATGQTVEIVQSLAKWKRMQLGFFGYAPGEGIYTDMNAIRRDDATDHLHSIFVDQWDWEKVITRADRTLAFLEGVVRTIVETLADVKEAVTEVYPALARPVKREVYCISTSELERRYPTLTRKEREDVITREYGTVFLEQIGMPLADGKPHDGRAPDYDDWALNGDLLVWNDILGCALELSSMGIRVDESSLAHQLSAAGADDRRTLEYHRGVLSGAYPLTVGGGIGQSRLCMYLLEKAHIGEVQSSVWSNEAREELARENIYLL